MEYLGVTYNVKHPPVLDPNFIPFGVWMEAYRSGAKKRVAIAVERLNGHISVRQTVIHGTPDMAEADYRYMERYVKFLLWAIGGFRVYICGCDHIAQRLRSAYTLDGERNFECAFFQRIYGRPLEILNLPLNECPSASEEPLPIGGHWDGCRIGFDAGGSDRKVSAVIDGKCVFSEEVIWDPKNQSDPKYHFDEIVKAFRTAASKMPRVDAIGVSSAGVILDNAPMIASLFIKVPHEHREEVKTIYTRAAAEIGDVPVMVANDGDVTALAGALSLNVGSIMGIAMGTGEAVGYVDKNKNLLGWINELSFAPFDLNEEGIPDSWSTDIGVGSRYFSQNTAIFLAARAGIELDPVLPPAEKLVVIQQLMEQGDFRAQAVFETIGIYLAYAVELYSQFYDIRHLIILGRVTSGKGGEAILRSCLTVLADEFPALNDKIQIMLPDENTRRLGQSVTAASLPIISRQAEV